MINTLFDQYQRYNNVRRIINNLRVDNEKFRVLEVGANEHRNLEKFLPMDNITYLDIQLPEELMDDPNYILGDATKMPFPDNEYDVIVALDVFEHITMEKRNQFVDEIYRVSSQICIVTAPFYSQQVVGAETRVNAVFKSLFNKNFIWLEEHMDNVLPSKDILEDYLKSKNISYKMIGHGNIDIWERLMGIHFFAAKNPQLGLYRLEIDKFYNSYIFDYDYVEESYRKVVVLEKNRKCPKLEISTMEVPQTTLRKFDRMERTFYNLCLMINKDDEKDLVYEDKVQVFIDSGQGFSESESECFQFNDKKLIKHISVDLHNIKGIQSIRIDPSNYSGFYRIEILKFIDENNGKSINYQITGNFDLEISDVYFFGTDDPNIILSLDFEIDILGLELTVSELSKEEIVFHVVKMLSSKENEIVSIAEEYKHQVKMNETLNDNLANNNHSFEALRSEMERLREVNDETESRLKTSTEKINDDENEKQELIRLLLSKELELRDIYESKAWALVVKIRKILGK